MRRYAIPVIVGILTATLPEIVLANIGLIQGGVQHASGSLPSAAGISGMALFFRTHLFVALRVLFIAAALSMFFFYAMQLLMGSEEENTITETKNAYMHAIVGAAVVSFASLIVDSFGVGNDFVKPGPIRGGISNVIFYMKLIVGTAAIFHVARQGIRLIILAHQEGELEKQKKNFFYGLMGVAMILLVGPIVRTVEPGGSSQIIAEEIRGIASFLLQLFGALTVLAMIVAGVLLVISVREDFKDRAKKTIVGGIIALVIVLSSYVIVRYFMTV